MTEIAWRRLAWLLLRTDALGVQNFAKQAPGALLGPALFGLALAMPLAGLFVLLGVGGPNLAVLAIIGGALPWAFLASFGPPRWPGAAQVLVPMLPADDRAIYAHSVLRILILAAGGTMYAALPVTVLLLLFARGQVIPFIGGMLPVVLAFAVAAALGRLAWGSVAGKSPRAQFTARLAIAAVFSLPGAVLIAGAPLDVARNLLVPFLLLASLGVSGFPQPSLWTGLALIALVAIVLGCAAAPVHKMAPRPTPFGRAIAVAELGAVMQRTHIPRSSPLMRRPMAPYPIPLGADRALRYLARQWLKVFLWVAIVFVAMGVGFAVLRAIFTFAPPQNLVPFIAPLQMLGVTYLVITVGCAASSFPGLAERSRAPSRKTDADRFALPAALRVGPPILMLKRWSYLQTLPFGRKTMERAFLRPLVFILLLFVGGFMAYVSASTGPLALRLIPWMLVVGMTGVWLGAFFVGRRSSVRHARDFNPRLNALHTLSTALWLTSALPLSIVGSLGVAALFFPVGAPGGTFVGLALFLAGAVLMPVTAYTFARERLVAVDRGWESPDRPIWLAGGAVAFCAMPVAIIVSWLAGAF